MKTILILSCMILGLNSYGSNDPYNLDYVDQDSGFSAPDPSGKLLCKGSARPCKVDAVHFNRLVMEREGHFEIYVTKNPEKSFDCILRKGFLGGDSGEIKLLFQCFSETHGSLMVKFFDDGSGNATIRGASGGVGMAKKIGGDK